MTVSSPNVIEIKLYRLIDDMRLLRSQMFAFDRHLRDIEASLKPSEPSEQQPESKSRPWFVAAASATARTVLLLFAVGAATSAAFLYLGTRPRQRDCDLRGNEYTPSGDLLPPSPPAEKATARQDQAGKSCKPQLWSPAGWSADRRGPRRFRNGRRVRFPVGQKRKAPSERGKYILEGKSWLSSKQRYCAGAPLHERIFSH